MVGGGSPTSLRYARRVFALSTLASHSAAAEAELRYGIVFSVIALR